MNAKVINDFKEEIKAILFALGKICSETNLKKMYREQTGHSLNQKLTEIGENSLHNFLRFKCKEICDVYRFDNEIKIQRRSTELSSHLEEFHRARKRTKKKINQAPKLNIPQNGIIQKTTFNRLNPQGFNRCKTTGTNKNLINAYRYPNPVNLEDKENEGDAEENYEYAPHSHLTLEDFVSLETDSKAPKPSNFVRQLSPSPSVASVLKQSPPPPPCRPQQDKEVNVKNRSDFPSLLLSANKQSTVSSDESEEFDSISMVQCYGAKSWSKVAQQKVRSRTPVRSRILKVSTPPKIASKASKSSMPTSTTRKKSFGAPNNVSCRPLKKFEPSAVEKKPKCPPPTVKELFTPPKNPKFLNVQNDDPIYLIGYHGVILDPRIKLSKPLHRVLQSKISFPVHMSMIIDPTHFCLHYDEQALQQLVNNMQRYYEDLPASGLLVHERNLQINLLVAVKVFNVWHRAKVCQTTNGNGNVLVMFSDFGHSVEVPRSCIRHMISTFADYPQLFFRAQLAGVSPHDSSVWSDAACDLFHQQVSDKELFAVLRSYNYDNSVYEVDLSEMLTSSTTIAEDLIQARLAKAVSLDTTFPYGIIFSCSD